MQSPMTITIELAKQLSADLAEWFEPLVVCDNDAGRTIVTGTVTDQAAAHALVNRVRDLGIPITSLTITQQEPMP